MRTLTKITTAVAATALVCAGLLGTAGAASAAPSPAVTVPGVGSVTLTGKVIAVHGKYVTIVLDGSGRKVVVEWTPLTKVVGDLKKDVKVQVVTLDSLLGLVKADVISVLG